MADQIPLSFPPSFTLFFKIYASKRWNNAVTPEVWYCHNSHCGQVIKERAVFENLYCNLFVSDSKGEGEAASPYLHHQGSWLAVESNSAKPNLSQVPTKAKQLTADGILPSFSGSKPIPLEVIRKNPSGLSEKLHGDFLGLWNSLGQVTNALSLN